MLGPLSICKALGLSALQLAVVVFSCMASNYITEGFTVEKIPF